MGIEAEPLSWRSDERSSNLFASKSCDMLMLMVILPIAVTLMKVIAVHDAFGAASRVSTMLVMVQFSDMTSDEDGTAIWSSRSSRNTNMPIMLAFTFLQSICEGRFPFRMSISERVGGRCSSWKEKDLMSFVINGAFL